MKRRYTTTAVIVPVLTLLISLLSAAYDLSIASDWDEPYLTNPRLYPRIPEDKRIALLKQYENSIDPRWLQPSQFSLHHKTDEKKPGSMAFRQADSTRLYAIPYPKTVLLIVDNRLLDDSLEQNIQPSLDQYVADLELDGWTVVSLIYTSGDIWGIRDEITAVYENTGLPELDGVVLIGRIPAPRYYAREGENPEDPDHSHHPHYNGYCAYTTPNIYTYFYGNLKHNGSYHENGTNLVYHVKTPGVDDWTPDIWVSIIRGNWLPILGGGLEFNEDIDVEVEKINSYFEKNHRVRSGEIPRYGTGLAVSAFGEGQANAFQQHLEGLTGGVVDKYVSNMPDAAWTGNYDWACFSSHGSPTWFLGVTAQNFYANVCNVKFANISACRCGNLDIGDNELADCAAQAMVMDPDGDIVTTFSGADLNGGMGSIGHFIDSIAVGNTIGKAFADQQKNAFGPSWTQAGGNGEYGYGWPIETFAHIMFGDGTFYYKYEGTMSPPAYFVDGNNGNDDWNGQYPNHQGGNDGPWKTINYAVCQLKFGDTCWVRSAVYNEQVDEFVSNGTIHMPITLRGDWKGEIWPDSTTRPVIDGSGKGSCIYGGGSNWVFENFELRDADGSWGCFFNDQWPVKLNNMVIHGATGTGNVCGYMSSYAILNDCKIYGAARGVYNYRRSAFQINRCKIYGNDIGIHCSANEADKGWADLEINSSLIYGNTNNGIYGNWADVNIKNSTIVGNGGYGIHSYWDDNCGSISNCIIANNDTGIYVGSGAITMDYNDVWNNGINWDGEASQGAHSISENPLFIDPTNGDYRLSQPPCQTELSPCVDEGDPSSVLIKGSTRTDGVADSAIVDMGYHYTATTIMLYGPWPMFQHDPWHTGRTDQIGPDDPNLLWTYETTGDIQASVVVNENGRIYFGSLDNNLYCLNPDGVTLAWTYTTGGWVRNTPALGAEGKVYFGSRDNNFYCLNSDSSLSWSYATGWEVVSPPIIGIYGSIYVGGWDHNLYCFNYNGTLAWSYLSDFAVWSSPALDAEGNIYFGSWGDPYVNYVYSLDPGGSLNWSYQIGRGVLGSASIGSNGNIYIGAMDKNFYCFNSDGTLKWRYETGQINEGRHGIKGAAAIDIEGRVYFGAEDNFLYCLNSDGSEAWSYETGDWIRTSPVIDGEGKIYIGSYDSNFYCFNPNGSLKWSYAHPEIVPGQPAWNECVIGIDGRLYVTSYDNSLYCFAPRPTRTPSATPTPTYTATPTVTPTFTPTPTPSPTYIATPTVTPTFIPTPTVSPTPTPAGVSTDTPTPTITPSSSMVRINFQDYLSTSPEGYCRDDGSFYGPHHGPHGPRDYGWR